MPIGYLITVAVVAVAMFLALVPLDHPGPVRTASWALGSIVSESPFAAFYWILAATLLALAQGDLDTPVGWVALGIAGATFLGTPVLVRRSLEARPAVEAALADGLGPGWQREIDPSLAAPLRHELPWARILLAPLPFLHRGVKRHRNLSYGDAGRRNLLDVYRSRARPSGAPVLIHLHGGGFFMGRKSVYSRALLVELARHGWVCISASYRLRPRAVFPDYLVDAKKVIAWARRHAPEYGADPSIVFVAGSSAGAHLAATALLTQNDSAFQPGFEGADTTVSGAICLFGYYGPVDRARQPLPSSPFDYVQPDAAPVLIAHGEYDMLVPVDQARALAKVLREVSTSPVVYAELPGGPHNFDLFHSIRFEILVDGIEAFAAWVRSRPGRSARETPVRDATSSSDRAE
ncbi:MAG TPA: alpha/beta hydrolase [Gaiella sp.]|jgi:acetyl esterase/lipase